jgi:pimeloyl-ACP methyl ester carboxylesterase
MKTTTLARASQRAANRITQPAGIALVATAAATAGLAAFNAVQARRATRANPATGEFVSVDGVKLHYIAEGEGPTIVLLHGNAVTAEDWTASGVFAKLVKTNRVIAFDRPGFGHSERPRSTVWTPSAQARLITKALQAIGEDRVTVVGHSFGTLVALALAAEKRELVFSLVLIGGYYYPTARVDVAFAAPPAIPVLGDVIRYTSSPLLGRAFQPAAEKQMFAPAKVSEGWRTQFPLELALRPSQIRAAAADAAIMIPAAAALHRKLPQVATTIIAGDGDKVVDHQAHSERFAGELPGSELLIVPGAGHMVHHTAAGKVAEAIRKRASA